jgi:hypothetical protein
MLSEGTMYGYEGFFEDFEVRFLKDAAKQVKQAYKNLILHKAGTRPR